MQVSSPYYVKDHIKQCCIDRCVVLSLKFELSESILKQLIKHLLHTFLLLFHFKSKYGCPISSKITKSYFILNIIQLLRGLKFISMLYHYWSIPLKGPTFPTLFHEQSSYAAFFLTALREGIWPRHYYLLIWSAWLLYIWYKLLLHVSLVQSTRPWASEGMTAALLISYLVCMAAQMFNDISFCCKYKALVYITAISHNVISFGYIRLVQSTLFICVFCKYRYMNAKY